MAMVKSEEFEFIKRYAKAKDLSWRFAVKQLRCLWTAYCLHLGRKSDTLQYDNDIAELFDIVVSNKTSLWNKKEFERFNNYMCEWLR